MEFLSNILKSVQVSDPITPMDLSEVELRAQFIRVIQLEPGWSLVRQGVARNGVQALTGIVSTRQQDTRPETSGLTGFP